MSLPYNPSGEKNQIINAINSGKEKMKKNLINNYVQILLKNTEKEI